MNKILLAFAAIFTSGIFAFSYLKEWISVRIWDRVLVLKPSEDIVYPYFHQSADLYLSIMLLFGVIFLFLCVASVLFALQKKEKKVFLCFVLTMLALLSAMINAAIK